MVDDEFEFGGYRVSDAVTATGRHSLSNAQPLTGPFVAIVAWLVLATIALAILAAIVGAPWLQSNGHPAFAFTIYHAFSFVCHQIPSRSFHLAGNQFAVCSRCTGLYSGFAVATMLYPLTRSLKRTDTPRRIWLILAAVPLAIDFSLTYFGIWSNTHASRFITGALLGSVAVFYIVPGVVELSAAIRRHFSNKINRPGGAGGTDTLP